MPLVKHSFLRDVPNGYFCTFNTMGFDEGKGSNIVSNTSLQGDHHHDVDRQPGQQADWFVPALSHRETAASKLDSWP